MNFTQFVGAMFDPFRKILDFKSRSTRPQFWPFVFLMYAAQQVVSYIAMAPLMKRFELFAKEAEVQAAAGKEPDLASILPDLTSTLGTMAGVLGLLWLVSLIPLSGAVTRRLHDTNRSGFWALPVLIFQLSGFALLWLTAREVMGMSEFAIPAFLVPLIINNIVGLGFTVTLIVFCVYDGTVGPNRFGEDPKIRIPLDEQWQPKPVAPKASGPKPIARIISEGDG
jgi:uncharacterized membrane protein YhaH (DUF805 family)